MCSDMPAPPACATRLMPVAEGGQDESLDCIDGYCTLERSRSPVRDVRRIATALEAHQLRQGCGGHNASSGT